MGRAVNFYNATDAALSGWRYNQDLKPDWDFPNGTFWSYRNDRGFLRASNIQGFFTYLTGNTILHHWYDRYEIFSRVDEARCNALGAQNNAGGIFKVGATYNQ